MSAQDIIIGERAVHVRELRTEVAKLKAETASLRDELASLKAHFDQAMLAAQDLKNLPEGGVLEIWDGWNLILGAQKTAHDRAELVAQAEARVAEAKGRVKVWIVLDGHDENVVRTGDVRVSYTGGQGSQRADKFICDYVRMATYLGLADRIVVRTGDKEFAKTEALIRRKR